MDFLSFLILAALLFNADYAAVFDGNGHAVRDIYTCIIAATRKTGGSVWGYKPLLLGQRLKTLAFSLRYGNTGKQYFHSSVQA